MESAAISDARELRELADTLKQWPGNAALEHEVRVAPSLGGSVDRHRYDTFREGSYETGGGAMGLDRRG